MLRYSSCTFSKLLGKPVTLPCFPILSSRTHLRLQSSLATMESYSLQQRLEDQKKLFLFAYPEMQHLKDATASLDQSNTLESGDIRWDKFPDTFPNLFIKHMHKTVRGKHVAFFASFFHPESMFAQLSGSPHLCLSALS